MQQFVQQFLQQFLGAHLASARHSPRNCCENCCKNCCENCCKNFPPKIHVAWAVFSRQNCCRNCCRNCCKKCCKKLLREMPCTTCACYNVFARSSPRKLGAKKSSTKSGRARNDSTNLGYAYRDGPRGARLQFRDRRRLDIFIKHRGTVRPARLVNKVVPKTVQKIVFVAPPLRKRCRPRFAVPRKLSQAASFFP